MVKRSHDGALIPDLMRKPTLGDLPQFAGGASGWPWTESADTVFQSMPNGSPWPRISVVTPSYNQGQFIEETIRSVLLQGYPTLEYIIIDGGSTDGSVEIIKRYEPWLASWESEKDNGQGAALNKGILLATGDLILWLNSDDMCLPGAFHAVAKAYGANPGCRIISGQAYLVDEEGRITGELRSSFTNWEDFATDPGNSIRQVSTFLDRRLFEELGGIDESLQIAMDTDLMLRFTRVHAPLILDDHLVAFRRHGLAKSFQNTVRGRTESDKLRRKYLADHHALAQYRKRSAQRWIRLSRAEHLSLPDRARCLVRAAQNDPHVSISGRFWSAAKHLFSLEGHRSPVQPSVHLPS